MITNLKNKIIYYKLKNICNLSKDQNNCYNFVFFKYVFQCYNQMKEM